MSLELKDFIDVIKGNLMTSDYLELMGKKLLNNQVPQHWT